MRPAPGPIVGRASVVELHDRDICSRGELLDADRSWRDHNLDGVVDDEDFEVFLRYFTGPPGPAGAL